MFESTSRTIDGTGSATLNESDRHEILQSRRRRHVLELLAERTAPVELDGLAVSVAAREEETNPTDDGSLERVAVSLHHIHLPKLAAFDLVDYDVSSHRVEHVRIPTHL